MAAKNMKHVGPFGFTLLPLFLLSLFTCFHGPVQHNQSDISLLEHLEHLSQHAKSSPSVMKVSSWHFTTTHEKQFLQLKMTVIITLKAMLTQLSYLIQVQQTANSQENSQQLNWFSLHTKITRFNSCLLFQTNTQGLENSLLTLLSRD